MSDILTRLRPFVAAATGAPAGVPVPRVDIEAEALTKRFGDVPIFSDFSFRLVRGEATALVGANGPASPRCCAV